MCYRVRKHQDPPHQPSPEWIPSTSEEMVTPPADLVCDETFTPSNTKWLGNWRAFLRWNARQKWRAPLAEEQKPHTVTSTTLSTSTAQATLRPLYERTTTNDPEMCAQINCSGSKSQKNPWSTTSPQRGASRPSVFLQRPEVTCSRACLPPTQLLAFQIIPPVSHEGEKSHITRRRTCMNPETDPRQRKRKKLHAPRNLTVLKSNAQFRVPQLNSHQGLSFVIPASFAPATSIGKWPRQRV